MLLVLLQGCDQEPQGRRRIKLSEASPALSGSERYTSTIHLEPGARRAIAVLFFENQTGDQSLEWLQKGLTEMLIRSLSQASSLSVLSTDRIFEILKQAGQASDAARLDVELAAIVSREANVEVVLTGAISRQGDSLQISVRVHEPNQGRILREESVEGKNIDAVFSMVDLLSERIKKTLALSLEKNELSRSIADLSTNSLKAWRFYSAGINFEQKAMVHEAMEQYEQALAADPAFVAACYKLSLYKYSRGERAEGNAYYRRLEALRSKATDKERYQIDRLGAGLRRDLSEAIAVSKRWLEQSPQDIDAYFNLGDIYFSLQNYDEALRYYQPILAIDPKYKMAYNQIGYAYAYKGDLKSAIATLKKYRELAPDEPNPYDSMGEIYYNHGDYKEAEKNLRQSLARNEEFNASRQILSQIYLAQGKYRKALEMNHDYLNRAQDPASEAMGYERRALIQWRLGQTDDAVASLEQVMKSRISVYRAATWKYDLLCEQGDTVAARQSLERSYRFIRDSLAVAEPMFLVSLANLSLWYRVNPQETIALIAGRIPQLNNPVEAMWARFYLGMLYFQFAEPDLPGAAGSDFADQFIGLLKDIREVPLARETWKSFIPFNLFAYSSVEAGAAVYDRLIRYCAGHGLTMPEMIFRLYLADLYEHAGQNDKAHAELRTAGAPEERQWLVIGPFDNTDGFRRLFPPEKEILLGKNYGRKGAEMRWSHPDDGLGEGYVNLMQIMPRHNWSVGYGLIYVHSPVRRRAQIRIGTNDSARLWLNGREVWRMNLGRDAIFDNDIVPVELQPGANKILIKVCNQINEWGFYLRITDMEGRGIPELHFVAADEIAA